MFFWQTVQEYLEVSYTLSGRWRSAHSDRSIWDETVHIILTKVDGSMLSRTSEHDEGAELCQVFSCFDLVREAMSSWCIPECWKGNLMNLLCPLLQFGVVLDISITVIEEVDNRIYICFHICPDLQPIIMVVVARKLIGIIDPPFCYVALDVGAVDTVVSKSSLESLYFSFSSNGKYLIDDSSLVYQGSPRSSINGHCVTEVGSKEFVDGMGVWQVAHSNHAVCFHYSMAGEVVSRQFMELWDE